MKTSKVDAAEIVAIQSLAEGDVNQFFDDAIQRAVLNCLDPKTSWATKRGLVLRFKFKPDEGRSMANGSIDIDVKLAPYKSIPFSLNFEDGEGATIKVTEHRREQLKLPV